MGNRGRWRTRWFKVIALCLPILLLLVVELLLRLFGYGHDTSLFIRYPDDPRYWVMNKYAAERYFSDTANETRGSVEPFAVEKGANTFRIFVLGESTTAGYPYFHNGSFDRWLQFRLMHEHPERHFEIINVSLTAVNSYTVLNFGKEVLPYQPDAVLVYTGHNEYYGALGVGSTSHISHSRWFVRLVLALRRLRLAQLIGRFFSSLAGQGEPDQRENLMRRMAADQQILYGSSAYHAGIRQFRDNMEELCRAMQEQGVPVFLSTLVSNEKDSKPMADAGGAIAEFAQGDSAWKEGAFTLAKRHYVQAKELDPLRFRAPAAIDSEIIRLCAAYPCVHIVGAKSLFEQASPHGILGRETLLEHVHPNLYGYALLSDAFYRSMQAAKLFKRPVADSISFDELLTKMPVTSVDSLNGAYTIMMLKSRWPFNEPIPANFKRGNSIQEQLAGGIAVGRIDWDAAMNELYTLSMRTGDKATALKAVGGLLLEHPANTLYALYAGRLSYELGEDSDAVFYFKLAYTTDPSPANLQSLYLLYMKLNQPEQAMHLLDNATIKQPDDARMSSLKSLTELIIRVKKQLAVSPGNKTLSRQLALYYHEAGADEAAEKYR
jgi:tetratricopeptide (TPR) repeat protein